MVVEEGEVQAELVQVLKAPFLKQVAQEVAVALEINKVRLEHLDKVVQVVMEEAHSDLGVVEEEKEALVYLLAHREWVVMADKVSIFLHLFQTEEQIHQILQLELGVDLLAEELVLLPMEHILI